MGAGTHPEGRLLPQDVQGDLAPIRELPLADLKRAARRRPHGQWLLQARGRSTEAACRASGLCSPWQILPELGALTRRIWVRWALSLFPLYPFSLERTSVRADLSPTLRSQASSDKKFLSPGLGDHWKRRLGRLGVITGTARHRVCLPAFHLSLLTLNLLSVCPPFRANTYLPSRNRLRHYVWLTGAGETRLTAEVLGGVSPWGSSPHLLLRCTHAQRSSQPCCDSRQRGVQTLE